MTDNPDEIRRDIERTRAELSENVNALGDSAKPSNIARGQVDAVKEKAQDLKSRVFGSDDDPYDQGAVGEARQAVSEAPRQVQRKAQGNPLAAGLIALGVGALIGGLFPPSRPEKEMARKVEDRAQPLVEEAKSMAAEAREHLQPAAQEALESVKQTAGEATEQVKSEAQGAKDEVVGEAKSSAQSVQSDAKGAAEQTRSDLQS